MIIFSITETAPKLVSWMEANVQFPNAMVDRITPVTTPADIEALETRFGVTDAWPVVCEPFRQWVVEDNFTSGRPAWDNVGAQFVPDVSPYEKMKIRMLNGSHTALAFTGILHTYSLVYETMADSLFGGFLNGFMEHEVTPILDPAAVPGVDLADYRKTLLQRFANPNIKDQLARICSETSAKAPKFLVATINDHLNSGSSVQKVRRCAVVLAAWCRYLQLSVGEGDVPGYAVQDDMKEELVSAAIASQTAGNSAAFLRLSLIFGDLGENTAFAELFGLYLAMLCEHGIMYVLKSLE